MYLLRSPQAAEYIARTNRYIAVNDFVKDGEEWIALEMIQRILNTAELLPHGNTDDLSQLRAWRDGAMVYLDEACRSLFKYDKSGDPKDLCDAEKFVHLVRE